MKREKRFTEMKTLCSLCLAKDIKLSSFLGGNLNRIIFLLTLIDVDYFYDFEVLILNLLEVLLGSLIISFFFFLDMKDELESDVIIKHTASN